jgi:glycosyltransferase involved in cell wall biosynthesis
LVPLWPVVIFWNLKRLAAGRAVPAEWPLLSVIVPARDEGEKIEEAMRSLLALDYPHLEIVAVDDRSRDDTGPLLDRIAREDSRLTVIHVKELPDGWLGKCHAMHSGAQRARGEILLFTDGDVLFSPHTLRLAVTYLLNKPLDHLCLNPQLVPGGYWENALVACFGLLFFAAFKPWLIPTRWPGAYCGIGAFNLVRRDAYGAVGGHERIRLDVLDDVNLGKILKQSGYRQQLLLGGDLIQVRWQNSFWGVIKGLEKNSFAAVHYSVIELLAVTVVFLLVFFGPYIGAGLGLAVWQDFRMLPYLLTVVLLHASYITIGIRIAGGGAIGPVLPVTFALFIYLMWRSAAVVLRQGGVRWRGTLYPLAELRRNQVR